MKKSLLSFLIFFISFLLCSCQHFLAGNEFKEALEKSLAYANAKKVNIEMQVDNASFGTIYPASVTVIKNEKFEVTFTQQIEARAVNFILYDKTSNKPLKQFMTYSETSEKQEDDSIIHKLTVCITNDEIAGCILKPVLTFQQEDTSAPVITAFSLYKDEQNTKPISPLHPDVWEVEGNGIHNDVYDNKYPYEKYKDTPYYQNCINKLFLNMEFTENESDIIGVKVTETTVRNVYNQNITQVSCSSYITADKMTVDKEGHYSLKNYPLECYDENEGMYSFTFSVVNAYGLETVYETTFYVIEHFAIDSQNIYMKGQSNLGNDYSVRFKDENGNDIIGEYEYTLSGTTYIKPYISEIRAVDRFYSLSSVYDAYDKMLCLPLEVKIEYYDEGSSEKKLFINYKEPGYFYDKDSYTYSVYYWPEPGVSDINNLHNELQIQECEIKTIYNTRNILYATSIYYNPIVRDAYKDTYIGFSVTNEMGLKLSKQYIIPKSVDVYTSRKNGTKIEVETTPAWNTNYNIYYRTRNLDDSNVSDFNISGYGNALSLTANKKYELYVVSSCENAVPYLYGCTGKKFEFKTDGSNNIKPINDNTSTVNFPTFYSSYFTVNGTPKVNGEKADISVNLPAGYPPAGVKYSYLFQCKLNYKDLIKSQDTHDEWYYQDDLKLYTTTTHKLVKVYAHDENGICIGETSPNITVDLSAYDNFPPYIYDSQNTTKDINYKNTFKIEQPNMVTGYIDSDYVFDVGKGLEITSGSGEINYYIKPKTDNSSDYVLTEEEVEILKKKSADFIYDSTGHVFNIPINEKDDGYYILFLRLYDKNQNYLEYAMDINTFLLNEKSTSGTNVYYNNTDCKWRSGNPSGYFYKTSEMVNGNFKLSTYSVNQANKVSNKAAIMKDLNGYTVLTDNTTLIQLLYSVNNYREDKDKWGTRGIEQKLVQVTSDYSVRPEDIKKIPSGNYWTVLVHFADGTTYMTPVEYKK